MSPAVLERVPSYRVHGARRGNLGIHVRSGPLS